MFIIKSHAIHKTNENIQIINIFLLPFFLFFIPKYPRTLTMIAGKIKKRKMNKRRWLKGKSGPNKR